MNVSEGIRRLGIVCGLIGAAVGLYADWQDLGRMSALWKADRRFAALMKMPVVQQVQDFARKHQAFFPPSEWEVDFKRIEALQPGYRLEDIAVQNALHGDELDALLASVPSVTREIPSPPDGFVVDAPIVLNPKGFPVGTKIEEIGRRVKAKYPGVYDDLTDRDLGARVSAKLEGLESAKSQGKGTLRILVNRGGVQHITTDSNGDVQLGVLQSGERVARPKVRWVDLLAWITGYTLSGFLLGWGVIRIAGWTVEGFLEPRRQ